MNPNIFDQQEWYDELKRLKDDTFIIKTNHLIQKYSVTIFIIIFRDII